MKSYILKLLAQSDSEAAKMLIETIIMFDIEYTNNCEEDYFTFFIDPILETDKFSEFFGQYNNNGKQVIEGTPVCWRVRDYCFVSIWLE